MSIQFEDTEEITRWVKVTITMCQDKAPGEPDHTQKPETLYIYDLPREVYERRKWVISWRHAKFICQYPRRTLNLCHAFYDKKTGLDLAYNAPLNNLISAKRMITKTTNALNEYKKSMGAQLFQNFANDPLVIKAELKIEEYTRQRDQAQAEIDKLIASRKIA